MFVLILQTFLRVKRFCLGIPTCEGQIENLYFLQREGVEGMRAGAAAGGAEEAPDFWGHSGSQGPI